MYETDSHKDEAKHWESLNELAPDAKASLKKVIEEEIPNHFVSRREFLEWMAALSAVMGSAACTRQPTEKILPYVNAPEYVIPGRPLYFASVGNFAGQPHGVLVESHMGRPTKIDGNELSAASLGGSDAFAQASILEMYDPDRIQTPHFQGNASSWLVFFQHLAEIRTEQAAKAGAGLRILTPSLSSPTLVSQIEAVLKAYPKAKWVTYDTVSFAASIEGAKLAFGEALQPNFHFDKADVVVSFDNDFLSPGYSPVRYTKDFSKRRQVAGRNRLYVVESTPTLAGVSADHRWAMRPNEVLKHLQALASILTSGSVRGASVDAATLKWADIVARDLKKAGSKALVLAGASLPAEAHALTYAINSALGSIGTTVGFVSPTATTSPSDSLAGLTKEMAVGSIDALFILGGNPAYGAPADVDFLGAMSKVKFTASLSLLLDETGKASQWVLPGTHFLEQWGDLRQFDGTVSVVQPLIAPLYAGKSAHEIMSALLGRNSEKSYDVVRNYWKGQGLRGDFEANWKKAVHDGVIPGTGGAEKRPAAKAVPALNVAESSDGTWDVLFRPDPCIWDGSYSNNPWLQELPKPLTKTTWENAVFMSKASAARLKVKNGDMVEVMVGERAVKGPAWIWLGHPDNAVTLHLGYGRDFEGRVGTKIGFNGNALRTSTSSWSAGKADVKRVGGHEKLACTQTHSFTEGRDLLRVTTATAAAKAATMPAPHGAHDSHGAPGEGELAVPQKTGERPFEDANYAWGMAINLSSCTGCNACVVACNAENNISTVGKGEVLNGREMHWLRIDRYYEGEGENASAHFQPVPCMHCESAPCEVVCPVNATTHSPDGINEMTYNRCVGTKYCSNNCPYKVRRFNFYHYADVTTPVLKLQRNPDVTVRSRGVMEKCTFCIQRVEEAKIEAKREGRLVRDGEIKTACQTSCPADAIVFGNIKDQKSTVSQWKASPLNYGMLEELNTRPRTTYLAKVTNPNPELASVSSPAESHEPHHGGHGG